MTDAIPPGGRMPRLRIDREGDWFDDDVQVTHPGVLDNLRAGLRRDAKGYYIQTRVRIPVEVEDTPVVVTRIERRGDALLAQVGDGTEECLDPATLRLGPGGVPYCAVKGGTFPARLTRAAAHQLLALASTDASGRLAVLSVGGREYRLGSAGEEPRA